MACEVNKSNLKEHENTVGNIFGIQRFSIHDGPGIRTTVFLKGCPLRCLWCHNPEGIDKDTVLSFNSGRCVGCGKCFAICPKVHKMADGLHVLERDKCTGCGKCAEECIGKALELVGKSTDAGQVLRTVMRDMRYYASGEGGMTVSGGEPMLQFNFLFSLLTLAKAEGINCAVETSGFSSYSLYERLLPLTDLFLFDYKESDSEKHKLITGVSNEIILENLTRLHDSKANIILRCPVIPGLNDRDDHFKAIAGLTVRLGNLKGAEILGYHPLGVSKTRRMGLDVQREFKRPDDAVIEGWRARVRGFGGRVITS